MRKFLVVMDDSPEFVNALRFAALRASKTSGQVEILAIIAPEEFQHWIGVAEQMRFEAKERIKEHFRIFSSILEKEEGIIPELVIREGDKVTEVLAQVKDDPEVGIIVLGAGVSNEGAYTVTIEGFDAATDKLTLVIVNGASNLTTTEFDQLANVEVTSDGISGTQILFAPDSNAQSGKLVLPSVEESFDSDWTATTYTVEIIADTNLVG